MSNTQDPIKLAPPFALFDEFGNGADDRVLEHIKSVVAALQSAAAQPQGGEPRCECNATTDQLCEVCTAHRNLPAQPKGDAREADGSFLLLPQRPLPEWPATAEFPHNSYSGVQMLTFGRQCSDHAAAAAEAKPRPDRYADEINHLRNVIQAACIGGTRAMLETWKRLFPDAPVPTVSAQASEPMFWVRLCSDGMYEGPIHNAQIEDVRKQSGAWFPLHLGAAPAQASEPTDAHERALAELVDKIAPGLDSGDLLADARTASAKLDATAQASEPSEEYPTFVIYTRPGMVPQRKGAYPTTEMVEDALRMLHEGHPDATSMVIRMPEECWPQSGVEWIDVYGNKAKGRLLKAVGAAPARAVEPLTKAQIAELAETISDEEIMRHWQRRDPVLKGRNVVIWFARAAIGAHLLATTPAAQAPQTFQQRVQPWLLECFGEVIAGDREERNHRFLEEALELVQACGCTQHEAHQLVDYVFGRSVGHPPQEVGGVMVTLAALCLANKMDMHGAAETELARIWTKVEAIRAKQAAKPKHSPLPGAAAQAEKGGGT